MYKTTQENVDKLASLYEALNLGVKIDGKFTWELSDRESNSDVAKLRLDWAVSDESLESHVFGRTDGLYKDLAGVSLRYFDSDINFLLKHGDQNSDDPLLKGLDGSNKHGKTVKSATIDITKASVHYKPKLNVYQIGIYVDLNVVWSD